MDEFFLLVFFFVFRTTTEMKTMPRENSTRSLRTRVEKKSLWGDTCCYESARVLELDPDQERWSRTLDATKGWVRPLR